MKRFIPMAIIALISLTLVDVRAAEVTLSWTNATQNTDGTTIPATGPTSLVSTTLQWSACLNGQPVDPRQELVVDASITTMIVTVLTAGDWCFVALHTNEAGNVSDSSNVAVKTVVLAVPSPPGGLTVTDLTVFNVIKQADKFVLLPVGTVPANTSCDETQSINGHYVVPNDAVTWLGNVEPIVVVAKCT